MYGIGWETTEPGTGSDTVCDYPAILCPWIRVHSFRHAGLGMHVHPVHPAFGQRKEALVPPLLPTFLPHDTHRSQTEKLATLAQIVYRWISSQSDVVVFWYEPAV